MEVGCRVGVFVEVGMIVAVESSVEGTVVVAGAHEDASRIKAKRKNSFFMRLLLSLASKTLLHIPKR